jgi:hypothetical protein
MHAQLIALAAVLVLAITAGWFVDGLEDVL